MSRSVQVVKLKESFGSFDILVDDLAKLNIQIAAAVATYDTFGRVSHPFPMTEILSHSKVEELKKLFNEYRGEHGVIELLFENQPNVTIL